MGKALSDLLENPLITGAIGPAFDAREKASQAEEVEMGTLNIPSVADIERLTRRLRAVSHRLEGIEDGVQRLDRALSPRAVESRLSAIEDQLGKLASRLKLADETIVVGHPVRVWAHREIRCATARTRSGCVSRARRAHGSRQPVPDSLRPEPEVGTDVPVRDARSTAPRLSRGWALPAYSSIARQNSTRQKKCAPHPHRDLHTPPLPLRPELAGVISAGSAIAWRRHQRVRLDSLPTTSHDAFARSVSRPTCSACDVCFGSYSVGLRSRH